MSDTVKLVIEIPREVRNRLTFGVEYKNDLQILAKALSIGTPLSEIRAGVKEKCDGINEIVEGELSYPLHRGIQSLLCDILDTFDKHIGKSTES